MRVTIIALAGIIACFIDGLAFDIAVYGDGRDSYNTAFSWDLDSSRFESYYNHISVNSNDFWGWYSQLGVTHVQVYYPHTADYQSLHETGDIMIMNMAYPWLVRKCVDSQFRDIYAGNDPEQTCKDYIAFDSYNRTNVFRVQRRIDTGLVDWTLEMRNPTSRPGRMWNCDLPNSGLGMWHGWDRNAQERFAGGGSEYMPMHFRLTCKADSMSANDSVATFYWYVAESGWGESAKGWWRYPVKQIYRHDFSSDSSFNVIEWTVDPDPSAHNTFTFCRQNFTPTDTVSTSHKFGYSRDVRMAIDWQGHNPFSLYRVQIWDQGFHLLHMAGGDTVQTTEAAIVSALTTQRNFAHGSRTGWYYDEVNGDDVDRSFVKVCGLMQRNNLPTFIMNGQPNDDSLFVRNRLYEELDRQNVSMPVQMAEFYPFAAGRKMPSDLMYLYTSPSSDTTYLALTDSGNGYYGGFRSLQCGIDLNMFDPNALYRLADNQFSFYNPPAVGCRQRLNNEYVYPGSGLPDQTKWVHEHGTKMWALIQGGGNVIACDYYFPIRNPTPNEVKLQVWLAVASDCDGVMYYPFGNAGNLIDIVDNTNPSNIFGDTCNANTWENPWYLNQPPSYPPVSIGSRRYIPSARFYAAAQVDSAIKHIAPVLESLDFVKTYSSRAFEVGYGNHPDQSWCNWDTIATNVVWPCSLSHGSGYRIVNKIEAYQPCACPDVWNPVAEDRPYVQVSRFKNPDLHSIESDPEDYWFLIVNRRALAAEQRKIRLSIEIDSDHRNDAYNVDYMLACSTAVADTQSMCNLPLGRNIDVILGPGDAELVHFYRIGERQGLHYDTTRIHSADTLSLSIRNPYAAPVIVSDITTTNSVFHVIPSESDTTRYKASRYRGPLSSPAEKAGGFSQRTPIPKRGGLNSLDEVTFTIEPGDSQEVQVVFMPIAETSYDETLHVRSNLPLQSYFLRGTGSVPHIAVDSVHLDFGCVKADSIATRIIAVQDTGNWELFVFGLGFRQGTAFSLDTNTIFPDTIPAHQENEYTIVFQPTGSGVYQDTLWIIHDAGDSVQIALQGCGLQGILVSEPLTISFDTIRTGLASTLETVLYNVGNAPIVVADVQTSDSQFQVSLPPVPLVLKGGGRATAWSRAKSGQRENDFSFEQKSRSDRTGGLDESGFTLAEGDSQAILVTFSPDLEQTFSETLRVVSNIPDFIVPMHGTAAEPHCQVDPMELDFGDVNVDSIITIMVAVNDTGYWNLIVNDLHLYEGSNFRIEPSPSLPDTITARGFLNYGVQFHPLATGVCMDTLTITHDCGDPVVVPLRGTGVQGHLVAAPDSIRFNRTRVSTFVVTDFYLHNVGTAPVSITDIVTSDTAFQVSLPELWQKNRPEQALRRDEQLHRPTSLDDIIFTLDIGDSQLVHLSFTPAFEVDYSESLRVLSGLPDLIVPLTGIGAAPHMTVDSLALHYGDVHVDSSLNRTITVSDTGYWNLLITDLQLSQSTVFSLIPAWSSPDTIMARDSSQYTIQFHPIAAGPSEGILSITHDGGNPLQITLEGSGIAPRIAVRQDTLDFGDVWSGSTLRDTIRVLNMGTADLHVDSISSNDPAFPALALPFIVSPNDSHDVVYPVSLNDTLIHSGRLTLRSDAGDASVWVNAHGIWTDLQPTPDSIICRTSPNDTSEYTILLSSVGNTSANPDTIRLVTNAFIIVRLPSEIIPAYGTDSVIVRFVGHTAGNYHDTLEIHERRTGHWIRVPLIAFVAEAAAENVSLIPRDFFLDQNFPNPFNPVTQIRFGLPRVADVIIDIYDILGRKVGTVTSGQIQPGIHTVAWNCSACPSGMYLVRMQADNRIFMHKMLFMK